MNPLGAPTLLEAFSVGVINAMDRKGERMRSTTRWALLGAALVLAFVLSLEASGPCGDSRVEPVAEAPPAAGDCRYPKPDDPEEGTWNSDTYCSGFPDECNG